MPDWPLCGSTTSGNLFSSGVIAFYRLADVSIERGVALIWLETKACSLEN